MKRNLLIIFTAICLVALCVVFASCNGDMGSTDDVTTDGNADQTTAGDATLDYTVRVVDHAGEHVKDVIVKLMRDGQQVSMKRTTDTDTVFTGLEAASYTVKLSFPSPDAKFVWDTESCVLTKDKTETEIKLYTKLESSSEIFADSIVNGENRAYTAYVFSEGASLVSLTGDGERNYFLFYPDRAGKFKIDFTSEEALTVGYYGGSFMVQQENLAEKDGSGVIINVKAGMVGGMWVIGIDSASAKSCVLTATRLGDPEISVEDIPWTAYTEAVVRDYYADALNFKATDFVKFDLTDPNAKAVYNEKDGYYHLNSADGAIIFITLGDDIDNIGKIDSIKTICEHQRMGEYVYGEGGKVVAKNSFNELFEQYGYGTVPLTEKLAYAIKSFGKNYSWWDATSSVNIFGADISRIVLDNAYLVACGYYAKTEKIEGVATESAPASVTNEGIRVRAEKGNTLFFTAEGGKTVTLTNVGQGTTVKYNGQTYTANGNGEIVLTVSTATVAFTLENTSDTPDFVTLTQSAQ